MRMKLEMLFSVVLPLSMLGAAELKLERNGMFRICRAEFALQCWTPEWKDCGWTGTGLSGEGADVTVAGRLAVAGEKDTIGSAGLRLRKLGENSYSVRGDFRFDAPEKTGVCCGVFKLPAPLPAVTVDGRRIDLAGKAAGTVFSGKGAGSLQFEAGGGCTVMVSGKPLNLAVIRTKNDFGATVDLIRVFTVSPDKDGTVRTLAFNLAVDWARTLPVSLAPVANMGFADESSADGKGGWTDQGGDNDLRMFKPGRFTVDSLTFDVTEPEKNGGKAVAVAAGLNRGFAVPEITLELPPNRMRALNLLHASAWTPKKGDLAMITAHYGDGSVETIPVKAGIDCGNWWNPRQDVNATVVWTGENPLAQVGLYVSSFPLKKAGPVALRFRAATPDVVWMLVGLTLSDRPVRFPFHIENKDELVVRENFRWLRLDYQRRTVKGSALDFSFLADAPAGKYGCVRLTPAGELTFEKAAGKTFRFFGVNLCASANFLNREKVDELADFLMRCGYNSVRIHHHDRELIDPEAPDSLTLLPEKLDQLDYLFYRMKENGLYVTSDLYSSRRLRSGDGISGYAPDDGMALKALIPVDRRAMENWKEYARRWMTHRNPYTGMTWAEDPAFFCVNLVNEDVLAGVWRSDPLVEKTYRDRFARWCGDRGLTGQTASNGNRYFLRFLHELQGAALAEQIDFVRNTLHVKGLVTSLNWQYDVPLTLLRDKFDAVDNHQYYDHPSYPEKAYSTPVQYSQGSALAQMAFLPRGQMPTRIFGKPFFVTEFNYCHPNRNRHEGGPLIGAYAALQGWTALYRFAWSHSAWGLENLRVPFVFDIGGDPLAQLSDRISILMFRRGDIETAKEAFAYRVPENIFDLPGEPFSYPTAFQHLGLVARIGSVAGNGRIPPGTALLTSKQAVDPKVLRNRKIARLWEGVNCNRLAESSTGQLRLDGNRRSFTVTSPRSESVTLCSGDLAAGTLRIREATGDQTVAALSLDSEPITSSSSVLVLQLTSILPAGTVFRNDSMRILEKVVLQPPSLIRRESALVELETGRPFKVAALSCDGKSCGEVAGEFKDGIFRFKADTGCFPGGVMAYHLTR